MSRLTILCHPTQEQLAAAFTEWDRRYREEPERFQSEAEHLLKETPETYGDACAPYFLAILREQGVPVGVADQSVNAMPCGSNTMAAALKRGPRDGS